MIMLTRTKNKQNQPLPSIEVKPDSTFVCEAANENTSSVSSTDTAPEIVDPVKAYQSLLDNVVTKRQAYDDRVSKHNDSLYEILSDCYSLAVAARQNAQEEDALTSALNNYKSKAKKKVQTHSSFEHVLVRFVFDESCDENTDSPTRHSVSVYAIVLQKASEEAITTDKFVSWIKSSGGLDKIRRKNVSSGGSQSKAAAKQKLIFIGELADQKLSDGEKITLHTTYVGKCRIVLDEIIIG